MARTRAVRLTAVAAVAALLGAGIGSAATSKPITAEGVGGVKLGKKHSKLRAQGLVGRMRPGCELGGPRTRSARLRRPLRGVVNYTTRRPRRVRDITIQRGAAARGVAVGDRMRDIKAAFPKRRVNHGTDETFGVTLVTIPRRAGGRITFAVDVDTRRITLIGVPHVAFCE